MEKRAVFVNKGSGGWGKGLLISQKEKKQRLYQLQAAEFILLPEK